MSTSDWINTVLAMLALAGVAVAIWAVLLSEHSTRSAFGLARLDLVADLAADLAGKVATLESALKPLSRLIDEQDRKHEFAAESQVGEVDLLLIERSQEVERALGRFLAEQESVSRTHFKLLLAVESLPAEERIRHSADISNQVMWLRACMRGMFGSLVHESTRLPGAAQRSKHELLKEVRQTYAALSEGKDDGRVFVARTENSFSWAHGKPNGTFLGMELIGAAGWGLLYIVNEIGHSLEYKRTHRQFVIPLTPKKTRELGDSRKVPSRL
ncbi:hypothetical protein E3O19_04435 [Cryobacterium algoritolerans]|uniref:Uncharacterized protein n=1 Tax=Cryobacterium algoritolerans TaxID=1259184 RepID=A0A4V3IFA0_9MICO|nr:hypothetical protein [Cryobacterium algoritolerans]TFC18619.1 hypothetical protein E3O19_04435 [Cryobacterium algoritolerans]